MRALILAAGQGTRLAPLTNDRPKCLVEIGAKSLLDHQLTTMATVGITDVTILTGYRADMIETLGHPTVHNREFASSNMVHTLFCARHLRDGVTDLIISYGDIVYRPRILEALSSCAAPVCVVTDREWRRYWEIRMDDPLGDAETLKLDGRGSIDELGKKPKDYNDIQGQYIGLIKIRSDQVRPLVEAYEGMDDEALYDGRTRTQMYMTSFIQHLIDDDWQVQSVPVSNGWLEVDSYSELMTYRKMYSQGTLSEYWSPEFDIEQKTK